MSYVVALPETMSAACHGGGLDWFGGRDGESGRGGCDDGGVSRCRGRGVSGDRGVVFRPRPGLSGSERRGGGFSSAVCAGIERRGRCVCRRGGGQRFAVGGPGAGVAGVGQEIQQAPAAMFSGFTRFVNTIVTEIVGAPADPPFQATQTGTFTGVPSLLNRLETTALWPLKPLLNLTGLDSVIRSRVLRFCSCFPATFRRCRGLSATPRHRC